MNKWTNQKWHKNKKKYRIAKTMKTQRVEAGSHQTGSMNKVNECLVFNWNIWRVSKQSWLFHGAFRKWMNIEHTTKFTWDIFWWNEHKFVSIFLHYLWTNNIEHIFSSVVFPLYFSLRIVLVCGLSIVISMAVCTLRMKIELQFVVIIIFAHSKCSRDFVSSFDGPLWN